MVYTIQKGDDVINKEKFAVMLMIALGYALFIDIAIRIADLKEMAQ